MRDSLGTATPAPQNRNARRVSAPVSLGSRGRRGAAYSEMDDTDASHMDDYASANPRSGGLSRATSTHSNAPRRPSTLGNVFSGARRRSGSDEESGWHLRED